MATPVRRIVDSSPLILLAKIGQLDLLRSGVPEVLVPDAVLAEVGVPGPADLVFQQIQSTLWLKIVPAPPPPPRVSLWGLGAGETRCSPSPSTIRTAKLFSMIATLVVAQRF